MDEIRKKSRNEYLKKRADKQVVILEEDLRDEKVLFKDSDLTKRERERLKYQKKVLSLTKDHIKAGKKVKMKHYFIPGETEPNFDDSDEEANIIKDKFNHLKDSGSDTHADLVADFHLLLDDEPFIDIVKSGKNLDRFLDPRQSQRDASDKARRELQETRKKLPVYEHRAELLKAIADNQIIVVQGETGCGKTTQLPQYLHEEGYTKTEMKDGELKIVGCTQPRRVAAMSVAARVSQEMGSQLGHTVGYSIRFEDRTSEGTVIKYMTDGMLLREFLDDPELKKYSVMIVDEAHERTLHTDILLTLLKDLTRKRPDDFRLIISSATLDEKKFVHFYGNPPIFRIKGRLFNVQIRFMDNDQKSAVTNMIDACLRLILQVHRCDAPGDILVFLPGQDEIDELHQELETVVKRLGSKIKNLLIRPIYANLPTDEQSKVFDKTPAGERKVVIATNIAETSLTIDGIVFVIDTGFCKQNRFSPKTGMETLAITRISKASADQRSGRAGRNRPGTCFRLYTREEFQAEFEENTQPEIQRLNLANVVLLLKTMNINNVVDFEYVDRPPNEVLILAIEQLTALGALDRNGNLTDIGRKMAEFPLDPKMSKAILSSVSFGCSEEVLSIMSMLSVNGAIFIEPKNKEFLLHAKASHKSFHSETGDHIMLLNVYSDWVDKNFEKDWCKEKFIQYKSMCRAKDIRDQLENLCEKAEVQLKSDPNETANIRKAILSGFFYNVARISREGGSYKTIKKNQPVYIHPTSSLFVTPARWLVYNELKHTSKEYMRIVSEIESSWLMEVAPGFFDREEIEEMAKKKMPKFNMGKTKAQLNPTYRR